MLVMLRVLDIREGLYFLCLLAGTLGLLTVSAQGTVLVTPVAVAAFAIMRLSALEAPLSIDTRRLALMAACFGLATSVMLYLPKSASSILRHAKDAGRVAAMDGLPDIYKRLRVPLTSDLDAMRKSFDGNISAAAAYRAAHSVMPLNTLHAASPDEYLATLIDLKSAQTKCGTAGQKTAITDFTNAASSLLMHKPASAYAYLHYGRSFSREKHPTAERLFGDVQCIFDPRLPIEAEARDAIWDVYGSFFKANYRQAGKTTYWRVFVRKDSK